MDLFFETDILTLKLKSNSLGLLVLNPDSFHSLDFFFQIYILTLEHLPSPLVLLNVVFKDTLVLNSDLKDHHLVECGLKLLLHLRLVGPRLLAFDLKAVNLILELLPVLECRLEVNSQSILLLDLVLEVPVVLVRIIKLVFNLQVSLFKRLQLPSQLHDCVLQLLVVFLMVVFVELKLLRLVPHVEDLILDAVVLELKLLCAALGFLEVSFQELVIDDQLVHSFLEAHAIVFEFVGSLSFVCEVLAGCLESLNLTVFLNDHRVLIVIV
jgi:hypothetical protein